MGYRKLFLLVCMVVCLIGTAGCAQNPFQGNQADLNKKKIQVEKVPVPAALHQVQVDEGDDGRPRLRFNIENHSNKTIKNFYVTVTAKDGYGNSVQSADKKEVKFHGMAENVSIEPGKTFGDQAYWSVNGLGSGNEFTVQLEKIVYADDTQWLAAESEPEMVTVSRNGAASE